MQDTSFREAQRLAKLTSLVGRIRASMAAFQPIAERARAIFRVPIALVSVLDAESQIYLGNCGLSSPSAPRDQTFCNTTIQQRGVTVIEDTLLDPRFAAHPFVVAPPRLRFYAGAPISFEDHLHIGTVCLADAQPRAFRAGDRMILEHLASLVAAEISQLPHAAGDLSDLRLLGRADRAPPDWAA